MAENTSTHGATRPRPAQSASSPTNGAEIGYAMVGTMVSGMAVWGGLGWLIDHWLGIVLFFPVGVLFGMAMAIYMVVKRYGAADPPAGTRTGSTTGGRRSRPAPRTSTQKGPR